MLKDEAANIKYLAIFEPLLSYIYISKPIRLTLARISRVR